MSDRERQTGMKRISIGTLLSILILAIALPVALFIIILISQLQASERAALERRTVRDAVSIAQAVRPVIDQMTSTLRLVSATAELRNGDMAGFHARTQAALVGMETYIIVVDETGQQLLNTRVPYGTPLGKTSDIEGLERAITSGKRYVSDVFFGRTSGKWVFNVMTPLPDNPNSNARAVITTRNAVELEPALDRLSLPEEWKAAIVDRAGNIIQSSDEALLPAGGRVPLPNDMVITDIAGETGTQQITDSNANYDLIGFSTIGDTGWKTVVWGSIDEAQGSILQTWRMLIIFGMIFALISGIALYLFSRTLTSAVQKISDMAHRVGEGEIVSPATSRIVEFDAVAKALSDASFDRNEREETITTVMRELSHRTKNLISVVLSMVRQSARRAQDPKVVIDALVSRILGLGQSIDLLTARDWGSVPLKDLLARQLGSFGTIDGNIRLTGPRIDLRPEAVQHLGMGFHELATNAVKYGGLSVPAGRLVVSWTIVETDGVKRIALTWAESGGPKVVAPTSNGFGTQILDRVVPAALKGTCTLDYAPAGLVWTLNAPLDRLILSNPRTPVARDAPAV